MRPFAALLRLPSVALLLVSQLCARLPTGMVAIAFLLHVQKATGSYADAGLVVALLSVGQAASGPLGGRAVGRWGARRVLIATTVVSAGALAFAAGLPAIALRPHAASFAAVALLAGVSTPPVQPTARTIYRSLVPRDRVASLLALDASLQEVIFVVAPVIATMTAAMAGSGATLLLTAAITLIGGLWFASTRAVGETAIPPSDRAVGRILGRSAVWPAVMIGLLLVAASAAVEVAVVAAFADQRVLSGALLAIYSLSSLLGGLLFAGLAVHRWSLVRRLLAVASGLALCVLSAQFWSLATALVVAGAGVAPVFALTYSNVSAGVASHESAEAFGWLGTGALSGAAVGAAVAGALIEGGGVPAAFVSAAGFAFVGMLLAAALVVVRRTEAGPGGDPL